MIRLRRVTDEQYKWRAVVVPQQGSLIEYTQTGVKGRDWSASVEREKQPHICTSTVQGHWQGDSRVTALRGRGLQVKYAVWGFSEEKIKS